LENKNKNKNLEDEALSFYGNNKVLKNKEEQEEGVLIFHVWEESEDALILGRRGYGRRTWSSELSVYGKKKNKKKNNNNKKEV
jgi:hypothetical protein